MLATWAVLFVPKGVAEGSHHQKWRPADILWWLIVTSFEHPFFVHLCHHPFWGSLPLIILKNQQIDWIITFICIYWKLTLESINLYHCHESPKKKAELKKQWRTDLTPWSWYVITITFNGLCSETISTKLKSVMHSTFSLQTLRTNIWFQQTIDQII